MTECQKDDNEELRQKAEHLIGQTNAAAEDLTGMSPQQIAGLVHELRVHQVELKMQNDELRRIQTELESARDRYLHLYDFAPTGYFTVDEKGTVAEANLTAATLLDRPRNALVGQMFSRFIHRDDQDIWYLHRKRLLETGDFQSPHVRLVKRDGAFFYVNLECMLAKGNGSECKVIRIAATDVTRLKQTEQALKHSNATLQETNQELNEYTYALTHNVKAPFRAVQNYANFLLEDLADTLGGEPRQFLDGIKKAIAMANHQFEDLETLYRVKAHPLEFESLDMRELLGEIAALHAGMPDCDLVVASQWPMLRGERFLHRQIFMALVSNGFTYNRSDPKRVEVTWQRSSDNRFEILVRDNGIGIDPQYHEHIFHIFKRLHTEEEYEGTGIGLAIVKRALQRIGGELKIESAVGQGSTFVISLPAGMMQENQS